jgi:hypothetical protein
LRANGHEEIIGDILVELTAGLHGQNFKEVLGVDVGDKVYEIMPHMVVAYAVEDGERGDKVKIALFEFEPFVFELHLCVPATDIVDAHILEESDLIPIFADVEIGGDVYV